MSLNIGDRVRIVSLNPMYDGLTGTISTTDMYVDMGMGNVQCAQVLMDRKPHHHQCWELSKLKLVEPVKAKPLPLPG